MSVKRQHEREAARVTLRKMLDGKKRGDRITAADVVEATGFDDWRSFGATIHTWAKASSFVLVSVPNDGWRVGLAADHIDYAEAKRRASLRRDARCLKALIDIPRAELSEADNRRAEFALVRAAARVQLATEHSRETATEFKLSERVPLRALVGGRG